MNRRSILCVIAVISLAVLTMAGQAAAKPEQHHRGPFGHFKHLVVIYEENHSFDNLYGSWGEVGGERVDGLDQADAAHTVQKSQEGAAYDCLLQNDVNLTSPPLAAADGCDPASVTLRDGSTLEYPSHFPNAPFDITDYIAPDDKTCAPAAGPRPTNGIPKDPGVLPGGCTRDLVHRFYQEQYQLDGGQMDRYTTGSDAMGLTQGYYETQDLPIYQYLHSNGAPRYVVADHFFQGAFGGSFLNHQYLIAAQPPAAPGLPATQHSVLDDNGYPDPAVNQLYQPTKTGIRDRALTQACPAIAPVSNLACGDWAVNTIQPQNPPNNGAAVRLPALDDTKADLTIGDRMSDAGVSWAWYSGGWDNANAGNADPLFQYHHQPFAYFARYAPGTPDRARHLKDESDFLDAVDAGTLPKVSFVKPIGLENEHPGYASEHKGSADLVSLLKRITSGPQAGNTLVVVTYDEFGGQWDHVPPPGMGSTRGAHDEWGPGTRIPALLVGRSLTRSGVDHTVYDTTSIMATIEHRFRLAPVDYPSDLAAPPRDRYVADLRNAVAIGRPDQR